MRDDRLRRWAWPAAAVGGVVAVLGAGYLIGRLTGPSVPAAPATDPRSGAAAFAEDEARNADILKLKADAEALVLDDRLKEAHAKYRQIWALAAGRRFRSPLLWDILERVKVDQDRIYWIIMSR
ncbi:MAG TPA: hypothetical protein VF796_09065, partial [Humisphaera sp.]